MELPSFSLLSSLWSLWSSLAYALDLACALAFTFIFVASIRPFIASKGSALAEMRLITANRSARLINVVRPFSIALWLFMFATIASAGTLPGAFDAPTVPRGLTQLIHDTLPGLLLLLVVLSIFAAVTFMAIICCFWPRLVRVFNGGERHVVVAEIRLLAGFGGRESHLYTYNAQGSDSLAFTIATHFGSTETVVL